MSSELAVSVLRRALADVKRGGGRVTDAHGEMLASLEPAELQLLQAASELVAKRAVVLVVAMPSQRSFFRVTSLNRFRSHGDGGDGGGGSRSQGPSVSQSFLSQPFDAAMASDNQPNYYNCFDHYCSCSHFHGSCVKNPVAMCKHMVAVLLADATLQLETMTIDDADFAKMLCPSAPDSSSHHAA